MSKKYKSILDREVERARGCIDAIEQIKISVAQLDATMGTVVQKDNVRVALFHASTIAASSSKLEKMLSVLHELMDIMGPDDGVKGDVEN